LKARLYEILLKKVRKLSSVRINFPDLSLSLSLSLSLFAFRGPGDPDDTEGAGGGRGGEGRAKGFRKARQEYGRDDFSFFDVHEVPTMDAYHGVAAAFAICRNATHTHGTQDRPVKPKAREQPNLPRSIPFHGYVFPGRGCLLGFIRSTDTDSRSK